MNRSLRFLPSFANGRQSFVPRPRSIPIKDGTPSGTSYGSEVLAEAIVQEDKFTRLAEAISADKYSATEDAQKANGKK